MSRNQRRHGFTLLEVMIAITLMTVGALSVMSLQRHVLVANRHARRIQVATQIAENWVERLRIDAMQWPLIYVGSPLESQPPFNAGLRDVSTLANTQWLRQISLAPRLFQTIVINPNPTIGVGVGPTISNAFDFLGQDVVPGLTANPHAYCSSFRLSWTRWQTQTGGWPRAMKADIRVWWPRDGSGVDPATPPFNTCADDNDQLSPAGVASGNYHFVQTSTVIPATP